MSGFEKLELKAFAFVPKNLLYLKIEICYIEIK